MIETIFTKMTAVTTIIFVLFSKPVPPAGDEKALAGN